MKKSYLVIICLLLWGMTTNAVENPLYVPDANFRSKLSSSYGITFDGSNNISNPATAATITSLFIQFSNISDLTGIKAFTALTQLVCYNNQITSLNLSANTALTYLDCDQNQLTSLNISANTALVSLYCYSNPLTSLDISANTELTYVDCSDIQITSLDVSANTALTDLLCYSNSLTSLDLSANTALTYLDCNNNLLTSLDVSANTALTYLDCMFNQLTSLDVSANIELTTLDIRFNTTPFTLGVWTETFPPGSLTFSDTDPVSNKVVGALPVELISFTATGSKLSWSTATESNNSGWEIEGRQLTTDNGQQLNSGFRKIGFVAGKGTTTEKQSYSFSVSSLQPSVSAFEVRLKQIDTDGKFSYSNILSVDLTPESFGLSQNYPNPFNPTTSISYQLKAESQVSLVVFDLLGREVKTLVNEEKPAGSYSLNFSAIDLPSGVYFYKLSAGSFTQTKKMTVMK